MIAWICKKKCKIANSINFYMTPKPPKNFMITHRDISTNMGDFLTNSSRYVFVLHTQQKSQKNKIIMGNYYAQLVPRDGCAINVRKKASNYIGILWYIFNICFCTAFQK